MDFFYRFYIYSLVYFNTVRIQSVRKKQRTRRTAWYPEVSPHSEVSHHILRLKKNNKKKKNFFANVI